jgi:thiol-disulfide isomerase/thioredoxin
MLKRSVVLSGVVLMLMLAACAPAAAPAKTPDAMMEKTPDAMMAATPDAMKEKSGGMMQETPDAMMAETPDAMMAHDIMTDTMMAETPDAMMAHDAMTDTMMAETPDAMMAHDAMTDTMMAETPDAMMAHDTMTDTMMEKSAGEMMDMPTWFSAAFANAATGENFMVQDFKGKVVLVETMAIWCPTCLSQAKQVKALHDQIGLRADLVSVSIDIDLNEKIGDLKDYAGKNGFDWTYTVATADVAREIGSLYGQQFLNPPSAPMFIIDRHGEVHPLPFGVKSADDLQKALEPFLNDAL